MERLRRFAEGVGRKARPLSALSVTLVVAGCGGHVRAEHLLDGSRAPTQPRALHSLSGRVVVTRVLLAPVTGLGRDFTACVKSYAPLRLPRGATVVERTGVDGASVTFRDGQLLYSCDASSGQHDRPGPWCGGSVGRIRRGLLNDPRLDLICRDATGKMVGFAWVEPVRGARYLVVQRSGYQEVYEVAGAMAVRVTTSDVQTEASSASFRIAQYARDGFLLARRTLHAFVAG
jgi:hypothetical protein